MRSPLTYDGQIFRRSFALLSGGDHSLVATHHAMKNELADEVVHIDTGIGVAECREFVTDVCESFGWPLRIMHPPQLSYKEIVLKYGFPGPGFHHIPYRYLKERAIRQLVKESKHKRRDEIALYSGVHNQESARRMGFTLPRVKIGAQIWLAPMFHFDELDFHDYKKAYDLPTSPVKKKLGFSGECLCGAFAEPGEIKKIERFYPLTAARIHSLEAKAKELGKYCVWGVRPPKKTAQLDIPFMPMCVGCHAGKIAMPLNEPG
jgi:3'-phosphoadenosine 5'-phosphosulfate sulfotransferase (PAPS reductase)/FAD synthetase